MDKLFDTILHVSTNIRNSTKIGKEVISIGDMAVKLTEEAMDNIGSKKILLIGTGETAGMVAKTLNKNNLPHELGEESLTAWVHSAFLNTVAFGLSDCCCCLLYTSPSSRDQRGSRMPFSA